MGSRRVVYDHMFQRVGIVCTVAFGALLLVAGLLAALLAATGNSDADGIWWFACALLVLGVAVIGLGYVFYARFMAPRATRSSAATTGAGRAS